jgi:hypothetical protein
LVRMPLTSLTASLCFCGVAMCVCV